MESSTVMPARDAARLRRAVRDFRAPDAPLPLAAVILGAHGSGWSYRTIARSLELSRDRTMQLAALKTEPYGPVPLYEPGAPFPEETVREFQRRARKAAERRDAVRSKAAATIKAAKDAGWSYGQLAALVDLSDEGIRKMALHAAPGVNVAPFSPAGSRTKQPASAPAAPASLSPAMARRLAELAQVARTATKNTGRSLGPDATEEQRRAAAESIGTRQASEELSELIIEAKTSGVPWSAIEAACGYRPGAARARAVRHGYGSLPPSRQAYQRSATPVDTSA